MLASAAGITSSTPTGGEADVERAGLEPAHVEQVADEGVEAVGLLVDRDEELVSRLGRPFDVLLQKARHRCLDPRERRAEVVRDGREDRCAQVARSGEDPRLGCFRLELLERERGRDLARERLEDAIVLARLDRPPGESEDMEVVELDLSAGGAVRHGRADVAWSSVQPASVAMEDGDGIEREDPAQAVEENGDRRRARQAGERLGLGAGPRAVGGPPRRERDEAR